MSFLNFDRAHARPPGGADFSASVLNRVIPVAPVNPPDAAHTRPDSGSGVINNINPELRADKAGNMPDPLRKGSGVDAAEKDWTHQAREDTKKEDPPPKPLAQLLIEHIRALWNASALAAQSTQAQQQGLHHQALRPPALQEPGQRSRQLLTYSHSEVKKKDGI